MKRMDDPMRAIKSEYGGKLSPFEEYQHLRKEEFKTDNPHNCALLGNPTRKLKIISRLKKIKSTLVILDLSNQDLKQATLKKLYKLNLTFLRLLDLSKNKGISSLDLSSFPNLRILNVMHTQVTAIDGISSKQLFELGCSMQLVKAGVPESLRMISIQVIGNEEILEGAPVIMNLPFLERIHFYQDSDELEICQKMKSMLSRHKTLRLVNGCILKRDLFKKHIENLSLSASFNDTLIAGESCSCVEGAPCASLENCKLAMKPTLTKPS